MAGQGSGELYVIALLSTTGRQVSTEVHIRSVTVEIWYQDRCKAMLNRFLFRRWLEDRCDPHVIDDVMWVQTPSRTVALVISGAGFWLLPAWDVAELRERV